MLNRTPESVALEELKGRAKNRELDFLLGAGISMLHPSNLPSGPEMRDTVLRLVLQNLPDPGLIETILTNGTYRRIIPEVLFADIYTIAGRMVFDLIVPLLNGSAVNQSHIALAIMAKDHGCRLYTTNFDLLLEGAGAPRHLVRHLHGDIRHRAQIAVLLSDVSRPIPAPPTPVRMRETLAILGYSGNDKDIINFLSNSSYHRIFWFARPGDEGLAGRIKPVSERHTVSIVEGDIHRFLEETVGQNDRERPSPRPTSPSLAESSLPDRPQAILIASLVLYRCGLYSEAFRLIDLHWPGLGRVPSRLAIRAAVYKAEAARIALPDAQVLLGSLAKINARKGSIAYVELENIRGVLNLDASNFDEAERHFKPLLDDYASLSKRRRFRHRGRIDRMAAAMFNNIGLCNLETGKFREAKINFVKSARLKIKLGNPMGVATSYINLALANLNEGNDRKTFFWEAKAEPIIEKYSLHLRKAKHLIDSSDVLARQGRIALARERLTDALNISRTLLSDEKTILAQICDRLNALK